MTDRSTSEWLEAAERYRCSADHIRKLISQEECPGGSYGRLPQWADLKAARLGRGIHNIGMRAVPRGTRPTEDFP
jgi:hypothetical protein